MAPPEPRPLVTLIWLEVLEELEHVDRGARQHVAAILTSAMAGRIGARRAGIAYGTSYAEAETNARAIRARSDAGAA